MIKSQSHGIFSLADEFVRGMANLRPALATQMGIKGCADHWGDFSPAGWQTMSSFLDGIGSQIDHLSESDDYWEVLGKRVLKEHVSVEKERIMRLDPFSDLNNIASPLQVVRETFDMMPKETLEDWTDIAARLESLNEAFRGYIGCLEEGRANGLLVSCRQVRACIKQCTVHASTDWFLNQLPKANDKGISTTLINRVVEGVNRAKGAYRDLGNYLESDYLPGASLEDAVGVDCYQFNVRRFLGATIDLESTYRWGWMEVARIREQMHKVALQIHPSHDIGRIVQLLKTNPRYVVTSKEAFIELIQTRQQDALSRLGGEIFDIPKEISDVDVRFAPSGGALGAYYHPPSEDFSRKGVIWYSKLESQMYPIFDEITTGYHEGFPGHHLQCGLQICLGDRLTRAHRLAIWNEGYGEGWALYAERLMDELGFLDQPEYRFGFLASQMLRACRVVIDIGMHLGFEIPMDAPFRPGQSWVFDTAVSLLIEYAFLDMRYAQSEVTRYLGYPVQAITYKIGEQHILDLRTDAEKESWFSLKQFHQRILGSGPVGLDHLRELILPSSAEPSL